MQHAIYMVTQSPGYRTHVCFISVLNVVTRNAGVARRVLIGSMYGSPFTTVNRMEMCQQPLSEYGRSCIHLQWRANTVFAINGTPGFDRVHKVKRLHNIFLHTYTMNTSIQAHKQSHKYYYEVGISNCTENTMS